MKPDPKMWHCCFASNIDFEDKMPQKHNAGLSLKMWKIIFYNEELQNEIMNLPVGIQARYIHLAQRMIKYGPDLGMPHTRAMGDGLFELRLKSKEGTARVFYCTLSDYNIMILHVFIKKSQKTPLKELKTARLRMGEVKKA